MATKLRVCQDLSMHRIIKGFLINLFLFRGLASSLKIDWYVIIQRSLSPWYVQIYRNLIVHDTSIKVEGTYLHSKTIKFGVLVKNALQLSRCYLETLRNTCT